MGAGPGPGHRRRSDARPRAGRRHPIRPVQRGLARRGMLVGVGAAAVLAALAWAFAPRPLVVESAAATVGPFEATIDEDGRTRLQQRYVISAPLAGQLARITLREGDTVEAGAAVATLLPSPAPMLDARSAREAAARVQAAQAQLQRADVRIERARVGVEQARTELRRSEQLSRDGFIAPTKLDADRLAEQAAQKELDTAVQERHVAAHDLEQARAAASAVAAAQGDAGRAPVGAARTVAAFPVRAPVGGTVLRVLQASEGSVAPGTPLVDLGDLARLEVVAEPLTTDALRTPPGTPVRVERWGGPGDLQGRVERVEPGGYTKVSALGVEEQRVKVIVTLTSPREQWRALGDGYRVGVRFVVTHAERALQVPTSAVFPWPDGGPQPPAASASGTAASAGSAARPPGPAAAPPTDLRPMAVFVVEDGRARLVPVWLRARNGRSAWIDRGLQAGTRVIVYPPSAVRDGTRVAERPA